MTVQTLPYIENLLSDFLQDQPEIAALVGPRVVTDLPKGISADDARWPLVRVTRVGGAPVTNQPLWLDAPLVQIEAFGGPKKITQLIAETCRAVIDLRIRGTHDEGVVTGARFGAFRYAPDDVFTPAKPRTLFLVTLWTHPISVPIS